MTETDAARRSPSGRDGRPANMGSAPLRAVAALVVLLAALVLAAPAPAAPGDLDPAFGSGGVTSLPGADRYEAQDAPLVASTGRITVAGLLRNASDRVFLTRLEAGGTIDASFGGGDLHTNVIAAGRRAATAITADGRVLAAGAGESAGRVVVERYTASGASDSTFGNKGRIQLDLGGTYARPSAAWALPDGKTLVAVITDAGGASFAVLRLTASGLDRTFGSNGIARVTFGTSPSAARDLEVLSNGTIAVTGSVGSEGAAGSDTGVARLQANGALDTSFGAAGRLRFDASGSGAADHAVAVAGDATGALTVTGPAGADGYVARITAAGALEPGFGSGGILRGGLAASLPGGTAATFSPADVALDRDGQIVVTGATRGTAAPGVAALSRWTLLRMARTGARRSIRTSGPRAGRPCPSATTAPAKARAASCRPGRACSCSAPAATPASSPSPASSARSRCPSGATLTVGPVSEAAGRRRIPLANVDPTKVLGAVETLQGAALRNSALRNSALRNSALRNSALRNSALRNSALRNSALRNSPVQQIALRNSSWEEILRGRIDIPLQYVTLGDVLALDPPPPGLAGLTLADVDLNTTALRNSSLAALLLEPRPLASVPGDWCARIAGQPLNCSNGANPATTTLLDLELAGDTVPYDAPIGLADAELGTGTASAELARILLVDVNLANTPFGDVQASAVGSLLSCGSGCSGTLAQVQQRDPTTFSSATLGQLIAALPLPGLADVTLGQVLGGLVPPEDIPFERAPLDDLLTAAETRTDHLQHHRIAFEVDCDQSAGLRAAIALPPLARIVAGSATRTTNGGSPQPVADPQRDATLEGLPTFRLPSACAGLPAGSLASVVLAFDVEPGATLGPAEERALVRVDGTSAPVGATATVIADDSLDAGDDPAGAQPISDDRLVTGHISSAGDVDDYTFQAPPGSVVTLSLNHLPADYDLLVFGPQTGLATSALRNSALRNSALRNSSTPDASAERASDPTRLAPDTVQDLALRNSALRNSALRNSSINRGGLDESATIAVRGTDAGETFTVRVAGYNGAHDDEPYVLRMSTTPPAPVKPCAPRAPLERRRRGRVPVAPARGRHADAGARQPPPLRGALR